MFTHIAKNHPLIRDAEAGTTDLLNAALNEMAVHLTLREFLPNLTMFLRAFEFLNHMMRPSRLTNMIPVPGSISSPEKLQILLSGT